MADSTKKLKVIMTLDDSQLTGGLSRSQKGLKGMAAEVFKAQVAYDALQRGFRATTDLIKDSLSVYAKTEAAFSGLRSVARSFNADQDEAVAAARRLSEDGLLSLGSSAEALKNILAGLAGVTVQQAETMVMAMKDTAAFNRTLEDYDDAIVQTTRGLRNRNSILTDSAGVQKNLQAIMKEAGFTLQDLDDDQKKVAASQHLVNSYLRESSFAYGDAEKFAETFAGQQAKLNYEITMFKAELGKAMGPGMAVLLRSFGDDFSNFTRGLTADTVELQARFINLSTVIRKSIATIKWAFAGFGESVFDLKDELEEIDADAVEEMERVIRTSMQESESDVSYGTQDIANSFSDMSGSVSDDTKKFQRDMQDLVDSFNDSMSSLLFSKRDQRERTEKELEKENTSYNKSMKRRADDFNRENDREKKKYQQTMEDLERDMEREIAKGVDANAERIEDLQIRMQREKEEYDYQTQERKRRFDEENVDEKERHDDRVSELSATLEELRELEEKYSEEFATIKDKVAEDDIARLKNKFEKEKAALEAQHAEKVDTLYKHGKEEANAYTSGWNDNVRINYPENFIGPKLPGYQHGTPYVPQTGMYMLHKGERVVPKTGADVGVRSISSSPTINFYGNMSVRSQADIDAIASQVSRVLGRQAEMERWYE